MNNYDKGLFEVTIITWSFSIDFIILLPFSYTLEDILFRNIAEMFKSIKYKEKEE